MLGLFRFKTAAPPAGPAAPATKRARWIPFDGGVLWAVSFVGWLIAGGLAFVALSAAFKQDTLAAALQNIGIGVLIAVAIAGAGAVLGFLFGIPRNSAGDGTAKADSSAGENASATARASTRPRNASLEQIADWLTKLMLGAGLTQIIPLKNATVNLAKTIGVCVQPATSADSSPLGTVFGLGVIGYFSVCGFLGGYLCTRLVLARMITEAELDMDELTKAAEQRGREMGLEEGHQLGRDQGRDEIVRSINAPEIAKQEQEVANRARTDAGMEARLKEARDWEPGRPATVPDDPQKGRFGGQAVSNGRKLAAQVPTPAAADAEVFEVILVVTALDGAPPLSDPVKFFLHDTFNTETVLVVPKDGAAQLHLRAWGAFTVGAMTDGGKTLLELDLSELPTAPAKFRSR